MTYHNTSSQHNSASENKKVSAENSTIEDYREIPETVEDNRHHNFTIIDNEFIDAGFDSDTVSIYTRIVRRAANNACGFFECMQTTAKRTGVSERQQGYSRKLLEFCNIIKITKRYDPDNNNRQTSSVLSLVAKEHWNLKHEWRNAGKFGKQNDKISTAPKVKKSRKKNGKKSALHCVQTPPAHSADPALHTVQTEQDHSINKITDEQDPDPNNGGVSYKRKIDGEKQPITTTILKAKEISSPKPSKYEYGHHAVDFAMLIQMCFGLKFFANSKADQILSSICNRKNLNIIDLDRIMDVLKFNPKIRQCIFRSQSTLPNSLENDFVEFVDRFDEIPAHLFERPQ